MHKPSFLRKCYSKRREGLFVQTFYKICLILMIIGGINWGLVGLFLCGIPGLFSDEAE